MKALITTVPFGSKDPLPLKLLEEAGMDYLINPLDKKLTEDELFNLVPDFDVIIAGTEPITERVIKNATNLKMISRVGIGLDSVDLLAARQNGILVSYTPDAPAPAVAELTIGLMLSLLRYVNVANMKLHEGHWNRYFGRRLSECTVGLIGMGRIGSGVLNHLDGFNCKKIMLNDLLEREADNSEKIGWYSKEDIYKNADIISVHLPLTVVTKNMIQQEHLEMMKEDAIVINTSRGGIINESDLYNVMKQNHLFSAAIDVFEEEPYFGSLTELDNCLLTSHMGSMSVDCRTKMEIEATEEAIRFFSGVSLQGLVPEEEYDVQKEGL